MENCTLLTLSSCTCQVVVTLNSIMNNSFWIIVAAVLYALPFARGIGCTVLRSISKIACRAFGCFIPFLVKLLSIKNLSVSWNCTVRAEVPPRSRNPTDLFPSPNLLLLIVLTTGRCAFATRIRRLTGCRPSCGRRGRTPNSHERLKIVSRQI